MLMYESYLKKYFDDRVKLADAIIKIINELYPKTFVRRIHANGRVYVALNDNRRLISIGPRRHYRPDEFGKEETFYAINVYPEHSIHDFLFYVFSKYGNEELTIDINTKDINLIINDLTKENYEKFLMEQNANKYNL